MRVKRGTLRSEKGEDPPSRTLRSPHRAAPVLVEEGVRRIVYDTQSEWQGYTHR
jgi:hypothetical protein